MESRRSSRGDGRASSNSNTYSRRSVRRGRDEEEEDEEPVAQSSKRRRQQVDPRSGTGSSRRGARQPVPVQEEDEEEEEAEADEEEGDDDAIEVDDDEEGEEPEADGDGGLWGILPIKKLKVSKTALKAAETIGSEDVKRRANDLARLALFNEHRRTALKREDITKKVLDKASAKAFPVVFNRAQKVLRYTFGYEMVELRVKGIDNEQIKLPGQSQSRSKDKDDDDRDAGDSTAKSRTYILRSLLPAKAIAAMATPNAVLSAPVNNVNDTVDGQAFDSDGVMLDWKRSNSDLGSMGLLFFILSLILLSGRSISDDQLRSFLRRMSLDANRSLPLAVQPDAGKDAVHHGLTLDDYLAMLQKQSYLECSKTGVAAQGAMSVDAGTLTGKRQQVKGRRSRTEEGEPSGEEYEWRWGARAEVEITEKAVADFVRQVYFDSEDVGGVEGEQDGDGEEATSRAQKEEQLLKHIEHAAGSQLIA